MKNTSAKKFMVCALAWVLGFALSACDDSSSAGDDDNNVILSGDSREESSDSRSNDKDEAISSSGKVTDKDSDAKSSDSKSNDPAEVTDDSSNSNSSGTTTKSSNSSAGKVNCSALLEGWSWDVPKECLFNPDIDYGTMTDERDGKVYRTVQIGDQVWMAENLNFDPGQGGSGDDKYDWSWCYNNEPKNCDVGGRLYTWAAAIDSVKTGCGYGSTCSPTLPVQGICPTGWHLPSNVEWNTLFTAVGGSDIAGKVLKSQSDWYSNGNGTDTFGFSSLPAGYRSRSGEFIHEGSFAYFWSSTEYNSYHAYRIYLGYGSDDPNLDYDYKYIGFSVRCVKDSN